MSSAFFMSNNYAHYSPFLTSPFKKQTNCPSFILINSLFIEIKMYYLKN
jgi:hypothetical protein